VAFRPQMNYCLDEGRQQRQQGLVRLFVDDGRRSELDDNHIRWFLDHVRSLCRQESRRYRDKETDKVMVLGLKEGNTPVRTASAREADHTPFKRVEIATA
jgi:hypothetical protein